MSSISSQAAGLEVRASAPGESGEVLSDDALRFVEKLVREFGPQREELLRRRAERQREFDAGRVARLPSRNGHRAGGDWTVAPIPDDLQDRRVEITGPADRKMIINALNSGANVFMADFEDANSPTWQNLIEGQLNLATRSTARSASPAPRESTIA